MGGEGMAPKFIRVYNQGFPQSALARRRAALIGEKKLLIYMINFFVTPCQIA